MVTANPYGLSYKSLGLGRFNFAGDTFKMLLTSDAYVPDFDTHEFVSHVTNEISGINYVVGGVPLTGLVWAYDAALNQCLLTCNPAVFSNVTFNNARRGVIYRLDVGGASTSPLLSWVDFDEAATPTGNDLRITFSNGIYRLKTPVA